MGLWVFSWYRTFGGFFKPCSEACCISSFYAQKPVEAWHASGVRAVTPLLDMCADGHAAFVAGKISQCLSEQTGEGVTGARRGSTASADTLSAQRRMLLASMSTHGAALLDMHLRTASHYLQQLNAGAEAAQQSAAHEAVSAALDAIAAAASWLPLSVLRSSAIVDACSALVQADAFRGAVIEVLMHASSRSSKQADSDAADYTPLYSQFAGLLVAACQLTVPQDHTAEHFEANVDAAAAAQRTADVVSAFVLNGHLARVSVTESQLQVLHSCWHPGHMVFAPSVLRR